MSRNERQPGAADSASNPAVIAHFEASRGLEQALIEALVSRLYGRD